MTMRTTITVPDDDAPDGEREVVVDVDYDYEPAFKGTRDEPPYGESATVNSVTDVATGRELRDLPDDVEASLRGECLQDAADAAQDDRIRRYEAQEEAEQERRRERGY